MDDSDSERGLREAVDDLAEVLEDVRVEVRGPSADSRGRPRLPSPREVLRFTERFAIPATVATLEATIRGLEMLSAALRVADGRPPDAADGASDVGRRHLTSVGRDTLRRLDDALAGLQSAVEGGEPASPDLRRLLEEARDLRAEVDDRLAEATEADGDQDRDRGTTVDVREDPDDEPDPVDVDVDRELESIKRDLDRDDDYEDNDDTDDDQEHDRHDDTDDDTDGTRN